MESLKNLINLFNSEKFFFMTTFLPVMLYKDFSETQRISIFYIMFWFSAIYQKYMLNEKISVVYILGLLVIVTFLSLEILTFDVPKLSLITNILYKIIDYIFIMLSQYGVIYIIFSVVILEIRNEIIMIFSIFFILNGLIKVFNLKLKDVISYVFPFDCLKKIFGLFGSKLNNYTFFKYYLWDLFICYAVVFLYSSLIYYYCIIKDKNVLVSISLLFIGILIIFSGDFKIRKIMELFKYLPSPVKTNEYIFPSECIYDISFFEWMDKFDKEKNYEYYEIIYKFLCKKKLKDSKTRNNFYKFLNRQLKEWLEISHMEISLIRSLGILYGRENFIRVYFFSVIYTICYTRSLRKFFEKKYGNFYSDIYFFRNYLLKICMKRFTLNFSQKVKYSSICNYMGERKENWSKEKFFVGCIGFEFNEIKRRLNQIEKRLKNEVFTAEIFNEPKYSQIVKKYNLSRSKIKKYLHKIKKDILVIEIINDSNYSKIIKKYNLSESKIETHLRKIVSNE